MKIRPVLLLFALAILLPMIVFSIISVIAFDRQQREAVARAGLETARALLSAVDHELRGSVTTLEALAVAKSLDRGDLPLFHDHARRVLASQREWITIRLLSPDARLLVDATVPLGSALPPVADMDSFQAVMRTRQPAVGRLAPLPSSGRLAFVILVPVVRDGNTVYVLSAVIDPRAIQDLLGRQQVPADSVATAFDGEIGRAHV